MRFNIYKIETQSEAFWGEGRTLAEAVTYGKEVLRSGGVSILDTVTGQRFTVEEAEEGTTMPPYAHASQCSNKDGMPDQNLKGDYAMAIQTVMPDERRQTIRIVEADSVEDYLNRYYRSERKTNTLLSTYEEEFKKYGFVCTSHYDNITGEFIAWPHYPSLEEREEHYQRRQEESRRTTTAAASLLGSKGGQSTSPSKVEAARKNGKKGGRKKRQDIEVDEL